MGHGRRSGNRARTLPQCLSKQILRQPRLMSLECHLRTHALQQEIPLLNHFVGEQLHRDW
jgi:hypothetical protein